MPVNLSTISASTVYQTINSDIDKGMSTKKKIIEEKITRLEAAKLLSVSVRTIDRYIRAKKLSAAKIDSAIRLSKAEVLALATPLFEGLSTPGMSGGVYVDTTRRGVVNDSEVVDSLSTSPEKIFEDLCKKLQEEVKENHRLLEMANYRVGQLEGQLKVSIPLIEHQNLSAKFWQVEQKLLRQVVIKWALILVLLTLLALQPLWFYFLF